MTDCSRLKGGRRVSGLVDGWMCGLVDVRMGGCADGWMCGWVDGWMCGLMDLRIGGCADWGICGFFDQGYVSRQIVDTIHELFLLFGTGGKVSHYFSITRS